MNMHGTGHRLAIEGEQFGTRGNQVVASRDCEELRGLGAPDGIEFGERRSRPHVKRTI